MEKQGNKFVCTTCGYQYLKGEHNAKILEFLNVSRSPSTAAKIQQGTDFSISTVKNCLERLTKQDRVERFNFKEMEVNPIDYRSSEKGKTPKYFYMITLDGEKLLDYYKKKGLI